MPITSGLSTTTTRLANTALALAFFPRIMKSVWPRVCGLSKSSSEYEPFAFLNAPPLLKLFQGTMQSTPITSYTVTVPNPVWKNYESYKRNQIEFDQTNMVKNRAQWHGVKLAQTWDYLLAGNILKGSTAGSQNFVNPEDGKTYQLTFDDQPIYSTQHTIYQQTTTSPAAGQTTYSNIITSSGIPATAGAAGVPSQDITVMANYMQRDIEQILDRAASFVDASGALIYPDLEPERQLIVVVPPILGPVADLAFTTTGTLGGTAGSSSGSVTNIGKRLVKDVIVFSLLRGCPDITSFTPGATVSPANPNTYWVFIDGDFVKPWYFQRFTPLKNTIPSGYDPEAEAEKVLRDANASGIKGMTPMMAALYATAEIDTNLGQLGNNSTAQTAIDEVFFTVSRSRGMIFPGMWWSSFQVDPVGESN